MPARKEYMKDYMRTYMRKRRKAKPEVILKDNLWHHYRLRPEDVQRMFDAQGGVCACCGDPISLEHATGKQGGGGRAYRHIDHDHAKTIGEPGFLRDLLCNDCNLMVGNAKDNTGRLAAGITYLEKHMSRPVVTMTPERVEEAAAMFARGASVTDVAAALNTQRSTVVSAMGYRAIKLSAGPQITVIPAVTVKKTPPPPIPKREKKVPPPEEKHEPKRADYWPAGNRTEWTPEQLDHGLRCAYAAHDSPGVVFDEIGMERFSVIKAWQEMGLPWPRP